MPPSLRSLLLAKLEKKPDKSHVCTLCPQLFLPGSGGTAWKNHFARFHTAAMREIEAQLAGNNGADEMEVESVASSSQAAPAAAAAASVRSSSTSSSSVAAPKKRKTEGELLRPAGALADAFSTQRVNKAFLSLARSITHSSVAQQFVETEEFREFLRDMGWNSALPTRKTLRQSVLTQSTALRAQLAESLAGTIVSIATDGWTNVRQEKVTNVIVIAKGRAFYWCSIVNTHERNTGEWLAAQLAPILRTLTDQHSMRVVSLVVDNEAVNKKTHGLLLPDFPCLLHIPCAAHTLQLIVRTCLKHTDFADTVQQLTDLIAFFSAKEHRNKLRRAFEVDALPLLAVVKPNDTRWSSTLFAAQRIVAIYDQASSCFNAESLPSVPKEAFLPALVKLVAFLKPFQVATDIIQSDAATLYTIYQQFVKLQQHVKEQGAHWAVARIVDRWNKQINVDATVASAILSFTVLPSSLDRAAAQSFIVTFGCSYILFYRLMPDKTEQQVEAALWKQIAEFNGRIGCFSSLDAQKASVVDPQLIWLLYPNVELAVTALALLSVAASEAAVERTFSAQSAVHSKNRNRLLSSSVEAEMFLKFNARTMRKSYTHAVRKPGDTCSELSDDFDAEEHDALFEAEVESDAPTDDEEQKEVCFTSPAPLTRCNSHAATRSRSRERRSNRRRGAEGRTRGRARRTRGGSGRRGGGGGGGTGGASASLFVCSCVTPPSETRSIHPIH